MTTKMTIDLAQHRHFPHAFDFASDYLRKRRLRRAMRDADSNALFALEIDERDDAYTVKATIPGVKREAITIEISGNLVSISVRTEADAEYKEGKHMVCDEHFVGQQCRRVTLPDDIDDSQASAMYRDGVLELRLPKKALSGNATLTTK